MVIDFHAHAFPDPLAGRALSALAEKVRGVLDPVCGVRTSDILEHMDKSGVDLSVLQPVVTKASQTRKTNQWAASIRSERLVSFAGLYPLDGNCREEIDLAAEWGLKGIKLHPEYQQFRPDAPEMLRLYDYILGKGIVLLLHAGVDLGLPGQIRSNPKMFAGIARAMKGGVIVAAHLGGFRQWDDVERYLVGEDIYLDTSMGFGHYAQEQFLRIAQAHGTDKILFGSDAPWSDAGEEIRRIRALPWPQEDIDAVLYRNAQRVLAIDS